jgi:predicted nucleic acid-binding protein
MAVYADTSFLASLYFPDIHSERAAQAAREAELPFLLTSLGELELKNALHLRVFRKEASRSELRAALADFQKDVSDGVYFVKSLPSTVFDRANQISRKRTMRLGNRTLDILHVASALELRVRTFYSFDRQQLGLAKAVGLHVLPERRLV